MSVDTTFRNREHKEIVGEPEVVEDGAVENSAAWKRLKEAARSIASLQVKDGSIPDAAHHEQARQDVTVLVDAVETLRPRFAHDDAYLRALVVDFERWRDGGFGVPDFLDSLVAFQPQQHRVDGLTHLVVFPMYTQNGNAGKVFEAVLLRVVWPEWLAETERTVRRALTVMSEYRSPALPADIELVDDPVTRSWQVRRLRRGSGCQAKSSMSSSIGSRGGSLSVHAGST